MNVLENKWNAPIEEMIVVAQRENNKKRGYLLVNKFQAKHVPVSPQSALELFSRLGEEVYRGCENETVVFIGFAETATAIGAAVAVNFPQNVYYIQTTREDMNPAYSIVDFREEHSHATEQRLYCSDREKILMQADTIIFVEDEITTGKTILNFINALKKTGINKNFGAVSIINSMTEEQLQQYEENNVSLYWLARLENNFEFFEFNKPLILENQLVQSERAELIDIPGRMEPRCGVLAKDYYDACVTLAEEILKKIDSLEQKKVLVLGTEECMYPAMITAKQIEDTKKPESVVTHSTTRSPILPSKEGTLKNRIALNSVYETGRKTFLYNLESYDSVIIVTDAENINWLGMEELYSHLKNYDCKQINIFRWVNE